MNILYTEISTTTCTYFKYAKYLKYAKYAKYVKYAEYVLCNLTPPLAHLLCTSTLLAGEHQFVPMLQAW